MKLFFVIGALLMTCGAFAEDATLVECKDEVGDDVRFTVVSTAPFEVGNVEVTSSFLYPPSGIITNPRGQSYRTNGNSSGVNRGVTLNAVKNYYQISSTDKYRAYDFDLLFENTLVDAGQTGWGQFMYKWRSDSDWLQKRRMTCKSSENW